MNIIYETMILSFIKKNLLNFAEFVLKFKKRLFILINSIFKLSWLYQNGFSCSNPDEFES
jgi:hypothetical protein